MDHEDVPGKYGTVSMQAVSDVIGDIEVIDSFRWLEEDADDAVIAWQAGQNARTVADLAASPHAAAVARAVRSTFEDGLACWAPIHCGDNWFRSVQLPGSDRLVLQVASSASGPGRVLLDPHDHGDGARLMIHMPSPNGELVLVLLSIGAATRYLLIDAADGAVVRDLGFQMPLGVAWTADSAGFYQQKYDVRADADGKVTMLPEIWWQPVVGDAERQPVTIEASSGAPITSADGRWAAVVVDQGAPRPAWLREGDGPWKPFLADAQAMYKGVFVGDAYWAITDDVSGWCRLVSIPIATADDRSTWREVIAARDEIKLTGLTLCGDFVALTTIESGIMRLRSLDLQGNDLGPVALPDDGSFGPFGLGHLMALTGTLVIADGDGCVFVFSSLNAGFGLYRADLATREVRQLEAPAHRFTDRVMQHFRVDGPHGPITYTILRKGSTPLDGTAPLIASGYGGFNVPHIAHYLPMAAAWTELGGVWLHAQLRGGGERDTAFWQAGRMRRKQGTFDDLYAVLEDVQARGFATAKRTGVFGTSNGGLLVGATVTQRPDLIRAGVAQVPILDLIQCRRDPAAMAAVLADYGDPNDPDDARVMRAYSPYHSVRPRTDYPALLCDAGADDVTTPAWHSRKMVAAMQAASASGHRIALRVRTGAAHNLMSHAMFIEREIEELTFFCDELMG